MLKRIVRAMFHSLSSIQRWADMDIQTERMNRNDPTNNKLTIDPNTHQIVNNQQKRLKVVNVWDYLTFKENTQASHIVRVLDYAEWTPMEEILRRINEVFGVAYQNERSLYPYLKTLVDTGLLEATMNGGKMRWRKKNLLITAQLLEEEEEWNTHSNPPLEASQ